MPHPLVSQLRFTRSEFMRAVKGVSDADARKRLLPMNCISWNIGHLAWQEQRYLLYFGQGKMLLPEINEQFAYGAPASTPPLKEVLAAWKTDHQGRRPLAGHPDIDRTPTTCLHRRQADFPYFWKSASANDLSLLVSHRREHVDPADAGTSRTGPICRQHRPPGSLPAGWSCPCWQG